MLFKNDGGSRAGGDKEFTPGVAMPQTVFAQIRNAGRGTNCGGES